jgi:hypothetical protein
MQILKCRLDWPGMVYRRSLQTCRLKCFTNGSGSTSDFQARTCRTN